MMLPGGFSMVPSSRIDARRSRTLEVMYGGKVPEDVPKVVKDMAECLERPKEMYKLIGGIIEDPLINDLRLFLARVQIDSELHMRDDVDYQTQRLWVAQTIERMVFGGLMVEGEKVIPDEEEDED
jgi:hypothetical protein